MKSCEQTQLIHAYHDGELTPDRATFVESHVRECPACEAELTALRATTAKLRFAPRPKLDAAVLARLHERVEAHAKACEEAGAFRMASWLTGAAAAIAVACMIHVMLGGTTVQAAPPSWETTAMLAIADVRGGSASGEYKMAQLMRDNLSTIAVSVEDGHD